MRYLTKEVEVSQEIKKSKFITYLKRVESESQAKEYLHQIREMHPKAVHHCYTYIIDDLKRYSDDGEPPASAGLPMFKVLEHHDLNKIIAIVVRYFGGIKLGVGGLIRAYSSSVNQALDDAILKELSLYPSYQIISDYQKLQHILYQLKDQIILSTDYQESVIIKVLLIDQHVIDKLKKLYYDIDISYLGEQEYFY